MSPQMVTGLCTGCTVLSSTSPPTAKLLYGNAHDNADHFVDDNDKTSLSKAEKHKMHDFWRKNACSKCWPISSSAAIIHCVKFAGRSGGRARRCGG